MTSYDFENINIICEGMTEVNFVKKVLNPFFNQYKISLKPIDMNGNVSKETLLNYVKKASTRIVTTLVDYYGFKNCNNASPDEIIADLKQEYPKDFFIPYLQVHEIEALWFSDIEQIITKMNCDDEDKISELRKIAESYNNPEDINNSIETAPSKRLQKIFRKYEKPLHGSLISSSIGIQTMMDKCPRFKNWVNEIIDTVNNLR